MSYTPDLHLRTERADIDAEPSRIQAHGAPRSALARQWCVRHAPTGYRSPAWGRNIPSTVRRPLCGISATVHNAALSSVASLVDHPRVPRAADLQTQRVVGHDAIAAVGFGAVQRLVGAFEDLLRLFARRIARRDAG